MISDAGEARPPAAAGRRPAGVAYRRRQMPTKRGSDGGVLRTTDSELESEVAHPRAAISSKHATSDATLDPPRGRLLWHSPGHRGLRLKLSGLSAGIASIILKYATSSY